MREKMFFPFSTEGKVNGTGLGLTLALHIAQEHGGTIELASSEPGRTVFHLMLPGTMSGQQRAAEGNLTMCAGQDTVPTRSEP
jgi:nitrogen-specific signal transduction histidine kinase